MNITVIGKIAPNTTYDEWVESIERKADLSAATTFIIPGGEGPLFSYVRRYAKEHGINVLIRNPIVTGECEVSKLLRNLQILSDTDFILAFSDVRVLRIDKITEEERSEAVKEINRARNRAEDKEDTAELPSCTPDEMISVEEEVELVKQIQQGGEAMEAAKSRLLHCERRFVHAIAKKYVGGNLSLERIIEEGNIGLIAAGRRCHQRKKIKFTRYGVFCMSTYLEKVLIGRRE